MRAGSILQRLWLQQDSWWQGRVRREQQILAAKSAPRPGFLSGRPTTPTGPQRDLLIGGGQNASPLTADSLFLVFISQQTFF